MSDEVDTPADADAGAGSGAALAERLQAQAGWLPRLCAHLAGRRVRAHVELDDLAQETLLRAVGSAAGAPSAADGEARLQSWLAVLARHLVIDIVRSLRASRRRGNEVRLVCADWSTTGLSVNRVAADTPGPATRVGASDEHARLMAAYDRLSAEHRQVTGCASCRASPPARPPRAWVAARAPCTRSTAGRSRRGARRWG